MVIEQAKKVLRVEAEAVFALMERVDDSFVKAVDLIYSCKGKVVVTGVGKSGLIGQKISSTLASTGTPSFFMHPAEGVHGDLGMLSKGDLVIAISNSGESGEISQILPVVKRMGLPLIAMT
ncbi:MAG: SIS domain-containing protein, partial [Deltaproteobacteria bacterium]